MSLRYARRPLLGALLLCHAVAAAAVANADSSPRAHDAGFFLRLSAGPGGARSTIADTPFGRTKMSGATADLNFAVGAIVAPNLALHGTVFGWLISKPDVEFQDLGVATANADVSLSALGAGLTYYLMPVNLYVSGSVGTGKLSVDTGHVSGDTDYGFVLDLTVGKEWWVGKSWGLGAAGAFGYHTVPDGQLDGSWSGPSFALRLTATYN
jgi:hypothetical protein